MNKPWISRIVPLLVLMALIGASALTLHTVNQMHDYRAAMTHRTKDLEALALVRAELAAFEAAHACFAESDQIPPALPALATALLPGTAPPELRDLSEPGPDGWVLRRHELAFDQVAIAGAMTFVVAAEQPLGDASGKQRPGWRLAKCLIRATPEQPGSGRVVVTLEGLVREGDQ
ncbi:MAG: hypothetical protein HQ523_16170 [Lentisphaerae bacterium]|nr:hypothetical protein [Lentisphaerota bacterium]